MKVDDGQSRAVFFAKLNIYYSLCKHKQFLRWKQHFPELRSKRLNEE